MSFKCFIAIPIDQSAKNELNALIKNFKRTETFADKNINWVEPSNMHLTLKFLGKVEDRDIPDICKTLTNACQSLPPSEFTINGVGTFPETSAARVIWAGIENKNKELTKLANAIDQAMNSIGFMLENRKFSPHITLARIKERKTGYKINEHIEEIPNYTPCEQVADKVKLIQSTSAKSGVEYTTMHHVNLQPL